MNDKNERFGALLHVTLNVTAELGHCMMPLDDVLGLASGAVIVLNEEAGAPVDLRVNEELIARGELVSIDDRYGVRITELPARGAHPP